MNLEEATLEKIVVEHADMPAPYGAYSTVVRAGDFLFVSGQAGIIPETGAKAGEDFESQARQAFENLETCLRCSGCSMDDIVKVITWLGDANERSALNDIFGEYFPNKPPARSTPIVDLPMGLLLSIEATAIARS
ncbi:RidA family protein [Jannaschia seohaensis]|uniref:RidA family protein n=1 Tax=Jannaschia seohaensis TaxID=475081 RepID=UPI001B87D43F|nr:Rid family hydrolase [Jannaschia seohaensis]